MKNRLYLKPHHVGISVANMEESIAWYQKHLDFELIWCKDFSPINTKISFLKHGDFQVELFEHYDTKPLADYRKHPLMDIQYQGTKHICFVMENGLEALHERLITEGVDAIRLNTKHIGIKRALFNTFKVRC